VAVAIAAGSVGTAADADIVFVDIENCPGPGSGAEGDPYCSIQTAIDNAVDTDEIVVAPGTYFETIDFLGKAVTLRSSDGPQMTIVDATGSFHVVQCVSDEGPGTVLDGFTLTGGNADGTPLHDSGGGMYNFESSPTVTNCSFIGNTAIAYGGAMYNQWGANPNVTNCTFTGNSAVYDGGGMHNWDSSPTVTHCTFTANTSGYHGGGMSSISDNGPTVTHCTFSGNTAEFGGGMNNSECSPTVVDCTFTGNTASNDGGGMCNIANVDATVTGCRFTGNMAADDGGGMYNGYNGDALVTNCLFTENTASDDGGGMLAYTNSDTTVTNCTFTDNGAASGGGMLNHYANLRVANCILWGDTPDEMAGSGAPPTTFSDVQGGAAGIGNINADPLFVDPGNGDLRLSPDSPCIDAGDNTVVPGGITTDLDDSPRFLEIPETPDTGFGDPPVVDMGAYESLGGGCLAVTSIETVCHGDGSTFTVNIEGLNACTGSTTMATFTGSGGAVGEDFCATLVINTEQGGFCCSTQVCVPVPDCSPAASPCDLDGDGFVGVADFLALLGAWGPNPGHPADLDFDGEVGVGDFLVLLAAWNG
jgi:parallel beta-helix repeat protein